MGIDETIAILGFQRSGVIVGNETTSRGLERDERCVTHLTARGQTWTRCGRDIYRVPVICNTSNIYIYIYIHTVKNRFERLKKKKLSVNLKIFGV